MDVLSLFDGMGASYLACQRAGLPVRYYWSSEIDKHAIKIAEKNIPNLIKLGDINNFKDGQWNYFANTKIRLKPPQLIIGGSPCQGFSFAGKQLAFDDPRSKLFFKFVEIVKYYQPDYFLLENVRMKQEHQDVITELLGVKPICINSSLVSAQNRVRYYWTNIPDVAPPSDKNIFLKDIIEHGLVDRDKSYCIDANSWKGGNLKAYFENHRRQLVFNHCDQNGHVGKGNYEINSRVYSDLGKSPTLMTHTGGNHHVKVLHTSERGRRLTPDGTKRDDKNGTTVRGYEVRPDGKTCALTTVQKDNYITEDFIIRKLTPLECERLQTLPDNYTEGVSKTQRYKMIGNGFTVDVIAHILSHIYKDQTNEK